MRDDIAWQEWTLAGQARQQAWRVASLRARHDLASAAAATTLQWLEQSRRAFERRDITIDTLALREVAYLDASNRALALARTLERARLDLNKTLGLPPAQTVPLVAPQPVQTPALDAQSLFDTARRERLDLLALRAGYQAQEYQLQRDLLARYPRFNLGLGQARDTGDVTTIGLSASITLPILNGGRGAVAIARATREQLRAEYDARLFQTRSDIATLVADIRRVVQEIEPLRGQLPTLRRAEAVMRGAAAKGDVTLVSYEAVRSGLLAKELQLSSLEQAEAEQRIALQLATGAPWHAKEHGCERRPS